MISQGASGVEQVIVNLSGLNIHTLSDIVVRV